jgi:hypothetical protein
MAELYSEGREANHETAEEIIKRLETNHNNYIPSSEIARRDYSHVLLKAYKEYLKGQTDNQGP